MAAQQVDLQMALELRRDRIGDQRAIRGADLLALAADSPPDNAGLSSLRRMMRQVITFHLGGGELKAWRVLR